MSMKGGHRRDRCHKPAGCDSRRQDRGEPASKNPLDDCPSRASQHQRRLRPVATSLSSVMAVHAAARVRRTRGLDVMPGVGGGVVAEHVYRPDRRRVIGMPCFRPMNPTVPTAILPPWRVIQPDPPLGRRSVDDPVADQKTSPYPSWPPRERRERPGTRR